MLTHGRSAAISLLPFKGRQGSQPGARPKIAVAGGPVRDPQLHHVGSIPVGRRQVKEMLAPLRIGLGHGQLCVPKTLSVLIGKGNHVTSAHNDRAVMVLANVVRFAVEVEEPS